MAMNTGNLSTIEDKMMERQLYHEYGEGVCFNRFDQEFGFMTIIYKTKTDLLYFNINMLSRNLELIKREPLTSGVTTEFDQNHNVKNSFQPPMISKPKPKIKEETMMEILQKEIDNWLTD